VRGAEFPPGWTIADYHLEPRSVGSAEIAYELWVVPLIEDGVAQLGS
jgi:hypothetical protein